MPNVKELGQKLIDKLFSWFEGLIVMLPNMALALGVLVIAILLAHPVADHLEGGGSGDW
jgi:hypothetical protein